MRAKTPMGVSPCWTRWASAFVAVTAILWLGSLFRDPRAMWGSIAAAAVVGVVIVVTWRLLPLTSVLRRRLSPTRPVPTLLDTTPPVDIAPLWDNTPAAVRFHGDDVVAVVAIDGPDNPPSVFDRNRVESATFIPLEVLTAALRQFDVRLSGIDVLSVGRRRASRAHHPYAATYTSMIGDHAAMGQRRSWCVLRMDRLENATAIASRDSVASTLAACAAHSPLSCRPARSPPGSSAPRNWPTLMCCWAPESVPNRGRAGAICGMGPDRSARTGSLPRTSAPRTSIGSGWPTAMRRR